VGSGHQILLDAFYINFVALFDQFFAARVAERERAPPREAVSSTAVLPKLSR
jgi:hypothetical protein